MAVCDDDFLTELTGARPFVFVIMDFKTPKALFKRIARVVEEEFGIACVRADDVKSAGRDLLDKIHLLIRSAEAVVAEISTTSENVFYEVGYAVAIDNTPVLLIERARTREVPADLRGLEKIEYVSDQVSTSAFAKELVGHLRPRIRGGTELLRQMLLAPKRDNNYILASPKYPDPNSPMWGQTSDTQTFGDYLAVMRLVSSFGSVIGPGHDVELVSARHVPADTETRDWNLYLIGSGNVNALHEKFLAELQGPDAYWSFEPAEGFARDDSNWWSALYRYGDGQRVLWPSVAAECNDAELDLPASAGRSTGDRKATLWVEDYGLIVRAPHPHRTKEGRLVFLLAGAHALGTGAAGVAVTSPGLIKQIRDRLKQQDGYELEDKSGKFWALVKAAIGADRRFDPKQVCLVDARAIR